MNPLIAVLREPSLIATAPVKNGSAYNLCDRKPIELYDPQLAMKELAIIPKETIPNFQYVIDWYKNYSVKEE